MYTRGSLQCVYGNKGSVVYDPLQTHVFVCNVYKGVMDEPSRIHAIHLLTLLSNPNSESMHYISHLNMFRYMFASTLGKIIFMEMRSSLTKIEQFFGEIQIRFILSINLWQLGQRDKEITSLICTIIFYGSYMCNFKNCVLAGGKPQKTQE